MLWVRQPGKQPSLFTTSSQQQSSRGPNASDTGGQRVIFAGSDSPSMIFSLFDDTPEISDLYSIFQRRMSHLNPIGYLKDSHERRHSPRLVDYPQKDARSRQSPWTHWEGNGSQQKSATSPQKTVGYRSKLSWLHALTLRFLRHGARGTYTFCTAATAIYIPNFPSWKVCSIQTRQLGRTHNLGKIQPELAALLSYH
jgi:hypothetical protein